MSSDVQQEFRTAMQKFFQDGGMADDLPTYSCESVKSVQELIDSYNSVEAQEPWQVEVVLRGDTTRTIIKFIVVRLRTLFEPREPTEADDQTELTYYEQPVYAGEGWVPVWNQGRNAYDVATRIRFLTINHSDLGGCLFQFIDR